MAPQVNFQATSLVVLFAAARKRAGKEFLFPEMGTVMGKQGTHCDKRLLAARKRALVRPLRLEMAALVGAEFGLSGEALLAHLAFERVLLLMALHVRLEVIHRGEALATALRRAAKGPQFVVRLQVPLELVRGGESPATAAQGALEGPLALAAAVSQQVHLQLVLLGEGLSALRLGTQVQHHARAWAQRPAGTLGCGSALCLLLRRGGGRRFCRLRQQEVGRQLRAVAGLRGVRDPRLRSHQTPRLRGRRDPRLPGWRRGRGQGEDTVLEAQQQVLVVDGDGAREGRGGSQAWGGDRVFSRGWGGDCGQAAGAYRRSVVSLEAGAASGFPSPRR